MVEEVAHKSVKQHFLKLVNCVMWKRKPDDLYIAVLKYGKKNMNEGMTAEDTEKYLNGLGYKFESIEGNAHYEKFFRDIFCGSGDQMQIKGSTLYNKKKYFMNVEAYFRLLEYTELQEARKSSTRATWFASSALVISIISIIIQICN